MRPDVAIDAVGDVLDLIKEADPSQQCIKIGFYTIGDTGVEVMPPTNDMTYARTRLKDNQLTSATSNSATYFDVSCLLYNRRSVRAATARLPGSRSNSSS